MALRALGTLASPRLAGRLRSMSMPAIAGPWGQLPAPPVAGDCASPSEAPLGMPASGLSPWSMTPTRGKKSGTKRLLDALDEEIKHQRENYKQSEVLQSGAPNGYQLEDIPGNIRLRLRKKHKGLEEMEVDMLVYEQPQKRIVRGDGADPDETETSYVAQFNVSVSKGDQSLVFECESDGAYVDIHRIFLKATGDDWIADFLGRPRGDMYEDLRASWNSYLEERGITSEMGDYVLQLVLDKECQEYIAWLRRVRTFVSM